MSHVSETWTDETGRKHKRMCLCHLTEAEALRKAQRAAAIAHLREIGKNLVGWRKVLKMAIEEKNYRMSYLAQSSIAALSLDMSSAISAYRAVGILPTKERKP